MIRTLILLVLLGFTAPLSSCALLSKKPARAPRYFTPDEATRTSAAPPVQAHAPLQLRLGRVTAASTLRLPIAYRPSEHEIRYYDDRRWTARPDSYLQHALERSLFERHGLVSVVSGRVPSLQVELTAFEELAGSPHRVRAEVVIVLYEEGVARLHDTLRVEEPVAVADKAQEADASVRALSKALHTLVESVAERSVAALLAIERARATSEQTAMATGRSTAAHPLCRASNP